MLGREPFGAEQAQPTTDECADWNSNKYGRESDAESSSRLGQCMIGRREIRIAP